MDKETQTKIETTLYGFIKAMNGWEKYCNEVEEDERSDRLMKSKLKPVFKKYCTVKDRKYGRIDNISYGLAGSYEYDSKQEKIIEIVSISKSKVEVTTETKEPMEETYKYVILKKKEGWLIDSKKRYSGWKKKWVTDSL